MFLWRTDKNYPFNYHQKPSLSLPLQGVVFFSFFFYHFVCLYFRLIVGLSVALGLFAIELIGFLGGMTMFTAFQSLLCIL